MSGQWEVVGKKKDRGSKLPVPKSNNNNNKVPKNKKNVLNGVKIDEVLPKSQVQNLYNSIKSNKENKKPQEKTKAQEIPNKKTQKKEKAEPPKPKPPKSIESALKLIDIEQFKSVFETSKNHYPDAPIIWLKELVQVLNSKLPSDGEDVIFSSKPENYPSCIVPSGLKSTIQKSIKEAGKDNARLFFDICLASMATNMSKDTPALGYKFFLQYIALSEPKLVFGNINKHVTLRNSYQNRPNICLSILWAVGQAGANDLHTGLTVFQELFLPLITMKNYSRYVTTYLLKLISKKQETSLSKDEFLLVLDTIYSNKKNFPNDLKDKLAVKTSELKPLLFRNPKEKYHSHVELFLKKINSNTNKAYQNCLCEVLVEIFRKDAAYLSNWRHLYVKNVAASAVLLSYINNNWSNILKAVNKTALVDLLDTFQNSNAELSQKRRKEDGLKESTAIIKIIKGKMVSKKTSSFPFKSLSVILALAIIGIVLLDVNQHGSWKESRTNKALKEYHVCEYAHKTLNYAKTGLIWIDNKIDESFPGYYKTVTEFFTPYIQLFADLWKIALVAFSNVKEVVLEKYPVVVKSIDSYAPGLIEQSQKAVSNAYSASIFYVNRSVDYLRKEVFVGQLSPENVQRVVIEAFNTTQQKATEYYYWLYEKVQTSIK